jgi:hypothetical protein
MKVAKRTTRRKRGRPKGSTVLLARDRQNAAIALWKAFRALDYSPHEAAYRALIIVGKQPLQPEHIEQVLTVAGKEIKYTASSLDAHLDALVRKAARTPDRNPWLAASVTALVGLIRAARTNRIPLVWGMLQVLDSLGWRPLIISLGSRIDAAMRSNVPPFEGTLGRQGRQALDLIKNLSSKKP